MMARVAVLHPVAPPPGEAFRFGLTERELTAEIGRCRASGWKRWELIARFGRAA